ncbi:uncharacterized protein LOC108595422 isoform X2 [Drosophila busckii]|uniref:uncharacterized protein LOC108595422 isoform X2 n=1 Tax=Drosophila busckii TaxID=30019 RepID=UPI00083E9F8E|nr:uncharacterized protein LOC108595422 isoform X2 [Drosophila busckii]
MEYNLSTTCEFQYGSTHYMIYQIACVILNSNITNCEQETNNFQDWITESSQENSHNNRSHSADTTFMGLERQRSISECSDDSFICFEEEDLDGNRGDEDSDASNDSTDDKKATFNPADVCLPLQKKVRFNLKPEVHKMHTWDFAYRAARKGMWQEVARDRERFKQRINRLEPILNIICSANHREKVYKERFLLVK